MIWSIFFDAQALICPVYVDTTAAPTFPIDGELVVFHVRAELGNDPLWYLDEEAPVRGQQFVPMGRNHGIVQLSDPLEVGQTYLVRGQPVQIVEGGDTEPPSRPTNLQVSRVSYEMPERAHNLIIDAPLDEDAAWLEVEIARSEDFSDALSFGGLPPFELGPTSSCEGTFEEYRKGRSYFVRARQVDATGNRSGWTEAEKVASAGCSTAGGGLWLALPLLALARRRERATVSQR